MDKQTFKKTWSQVRAAIRGSEIVAERDHEYVHISEDEGKWVPYYNVIKCPSIHLLIRPVDDFFWHQIIGSIHTKPRSLAERLHNYKVNTGSVPYDVEYTYN